MFSYGSSGALPSASRLLGKRTGADMNSTADQAITINAAKYLIRSIVVFDSSGSLTLAAGGVYTGAAKTGTILVAAAQVYAALTVATKILPLTLTAAATADYLAATSLFLSLTVAQGAAMTATVAVYGDDLS